MGRNDKKTKRCKVRRGSLCKKTWNSHQIESKFVLFWAYIEGSCPKHMVLTQMFSTDAHPNRCKMHVKDAPRKAPRRCQTKTICKCSRVEMKAHSGDQRRRPLPMGPLRHTSATILPGPPKCFLVERKSQKLAQGGCAWSCVQSNTE